MAMPTPTRARELAREYERLLTRRDCASKVGYGSTHVIVDHVEDSLARFHDSHADEILSILHAYGRQS